MKTFLALYMGTDDPNGPSPAEMSPAEVGRGMAAWGAWMEAHAKDVVMPGGPLGKTKQAARDGVSDIRNAVSGFTIVQAESHAAAAAMFKDHPHFAIFPGKSVEIMECLPIPTAPQ